MSDNKENYVCINIIVLRQIKGVDSKQSSSFQDNRKEFFLFVFSLIGTRVALALYSEAWIKISFFSDILDYIWSVILG